MVPKKEVGLLFDIDGCLTLPDFSTSILDIELIDKIYELFQLGIPTAFVTGRSVGWIEEQYKYQNRMKYFEIPTYIEHGLAYLNNQNPVIHDEGKTFLSVRERLVALLAQITEEEGILFESDTMYDDYPSHGSLWFENKFVQLSIAGNENVSPELVHQLTDKAWDDYKNKVRILQHHLGVDVIPLNWSKSKAVEHFIENFSEDSYHWIVFGDNISDKEMGNVLTFWEFVSTSDNNSLDVGRKLLELGYNV
ncbi:MAG: HAD-IIB family hydrolase [Candidatus Kariarchaeaceae archaeon]